MRHFYLDFELPPSLKNLQQISSLGQPLSVDISNFPMYSSIREIFVTCSISKQLHSQIFVSQVCNFEEKNKEKFQENCTQMYHPFQVSLLNELFFSNFFLFISHSILLIVQDAHSIIYQNINTPRLLLQRDKKTMRHLEITFNEKFQDPFQYKHWDHEVHISRNLVFRKPYTGVSNRSRNKNPASLPITVMVGLFTT